MCEEIISSLHDAGKDDISVVVITGSGSSFSYGWDLDQFRDLHLADRKHLLQKYRYSNCNGSYTYLYMYVYGKYTFTTINPLH